MSNKNLLSESQVRKFMKLARLEPLTPGFVNGLTEKAAFDKGQETEVGGKADESPTKGQKLTHSGKGRGEKKGDEAYVNEAEDEAAEAELTEAEEEEDLDERRQTRPPGGGPGGGGTSHGRSSEPLPGDNALMREEDEEIGLEAEIGDDEAAAEVELEPPMEDPGLEGGGDRTVSVDDFLAALESALEDVMGDEVEVTEEPPEEEEMEVVDDLGPGDEEVGFGAEEELQEDAATTQSIDDLVEQVTKRVAARILKSALKK